MVVFGAVAREQGFAITRVQRAFPDCEAMREIEPEKWQPQKREFEYESRNFCSTCIRWPDAMGLFAGNIIGRNVRWKCWS
jgi:hypothetical protein